MCSPGERGYVSGCASDGSFVDDIGGAFDAEVDVLGEGTAGLAD